MSTSTSGPAHPLFLLAALDRLVEEHRGRTADRQALVAEFARPRLAAELADTFDRVLAETG